MSGADSAVVVEVVGDGLASRMPDSSNVSRSAARRYGKESAWYSGESRGGRAASWKAERLPPGKTCAEGNDEEVCTR